MKSIQLRIYEAKAGFENSINEELNPEQKKKIDSYGDNSAANNLSGHVFPKGQDRVTVPLAYQSVPPHPDVKDHLEKHGYKVTDYVAGKAQDEYGRETNIGKALNKTKASPETMHAFVKDPNRQSINSAKPLKVIISKHPHDVAGMSTDRHWTSCMTMPGVGKTKGGKDEIPGKYVHKLKDDIEQGSHVAYLVHHDDNDITHPVARIGLKPHHSIEGDHTVLRPEGIAYGNSNHAFEKTVSDFAEKNYPMKGVAYRKNQNLYDDDESGQKLLHNKNATPEEIDKALSHKDRNVAEIAASHPNASSENITKAMKHKSVDVAAAALQNKNATQEHIERGLNNSINDDIRGHAARHPNASSEQIHRALDDDLSHVRSSAMQNPSAKPEHIDKGLDRKQSKFTRFSAAKHPNSSSENITKALSDVDHEVRESAIQGSLNNPNTTEEHITKALKDPHNLVQSTAIQHKKVTPEHITQALNLKGSHNAYTRMMAIQHDKVTPEHITQALDDDDSRVRTYAVEHPNATKEHVVKGLRDGSSMVRTASDRVAKERGYQERRNMSLESYIPSRKERFISFKSFVKGIDNE